MPNFQFSFVLKACKNRDLLKPKGLAEEARSVLICEFPQNEESVPHTSEFHHLTRICPKQFSVLAHLGCTCKAGTS